MIFRNDSATSILKMSPLEARFDCDLHTFAASALCRAVVSWHFVASRQPIGSKDAKEAPKSKSAKKAKSGGKEY